MAHLQALTSAQLSEVADKLSTADHHTDNESTGGSPPTSPFDIDTDNEEDERPPRGDNRLDKMVETLTLAVRQQGKEIAGIASQSAMNYHTKGFQIPRPSSYAGSADEKVSAINFLKQYQRYLSMVYPTHDNKLKARMFPACLTGRAYRWFMQLNDQINSDWVQLKEAFIDRFTSMNHLKLESSYRFREQQENESVAQYTDSMEMLLDQSDLDTHAKVDYYIRGLKRCIALPVFSKKPKTLEEAEKYALETEMLKADTANNTSPADLRQLKVEIESLCASVRSASLASFQQKPNQSSETNQSNSKPRDFGRNRGRGRGNNNNRSRLPQQNQQYGTPYNQQHGQVIDHRYQQLAPSQQAPAFPPPAFYYGQPPPAPYQPGPPTSQSYQPDQVQRSSNSQGYSQPRQQQQGN